MEKEEKEDIKEVVKEVVKEERKSHIWLITCLVICLMAVCGAFGWLAGASYFAFREKAEVKEEEKTEEEQEPKVEEVNFPNSVSESVYKLVENLGRDQKKLSDSAYYRKQLVNYELDSVKRWTNDEGQSVAYVDYETYKNKYEEIYGENYNFEADYRESTVGGSSVDSCSGHPSAGENGVCWMIPGVTHAPVFSLTDQYQDGNQYIMKGTFSELYDNGVEQKGTYTVTYTTKDSKVYLKEITTERN